MAYPPSDPANNKANATATIDDHAPHHNALADALIDIIDELGSGPKGGSADLTARLSALDTTVAAKVAAALFDANTILKADTDNTPEALPVAEERVVGRITGGEITDLTAAQVRTLLSLTDEHIQDLVGAMVSGGTETGISVTYDDTNARLDFVVEVPQTEFDAHLNDTADAHDASAISYAGRTNMAATEVEAALDELAAQRSTFSNADYTVLATDKYVAQTGTLSAPRTVTLPAANAVPAGHRVTIADESGTVTLANYLLISRAGSDTIVNPGDIVATTSVRFGGPYETRELTSDGTSKWIVNVTTRKPYTWWTHSRAIAIPTGVWTPLPWNQPLTDLFGLTPGLISYNSSSVYVSGAQTTIAAASDGLTLPRATINVADTTNFASSGYLTITAPPGASTDTVVGYTGKTGTSFTGCNTGVNAGIATGTMATGQLVEQANVAWSFDSGYIWTSVAEVAMTSLATTAYMGLRFRSMDGFLNLPGASQHAAGINITNQHLQCTMQPGGTTPVRVEVIQNSGAVVNVAKDGIQSPSLMQGFLSSA